MKLNSVKASNTKEHGRTSTTLHYKLIFDVVTA